MSTINYDFLNIVYTKAMINFWPIYLTIASIQFKGSMMKSILSWKILGLVLWVVWWHGHTQIQFALSATQRTAGRHTTLPYPVAVMAWKLQTFRLQTRHIPDILFRPRRQRLRTVSTTKAFCADRNISGCETCVHMDMSVL